MSSGPSRVEGDPFERLDSDPEARAVLMKYAARSRMAESIMSLAGVDDGIPASEQDTIWSHAWRITELSIP